QKERRVQAAKTFKTTIGKVKSGQKGAINALRSALYASKICSYAQGFDLLATASKEFGYGCKLHEMSRIWKGGCIIRAVFLDRIYQAFQRNPNLSNLLLDADFSKDIRGRQDDWRKTVALTVKAGVTAPAMVASL